MNVERPQSLTRLMKTRESTSCLCTCILMLIPPLPRLPAFDDSGRGRLHSAVPVPVATHLPAHRLCTAASPPGGSCAVHDGHPPQRRSSAILPPPSSRGKGLNEDPLCKCDAKRMKKDVTGASCQPFADPLCAACVTVLLLCLRPVRLGRYSPPPLSPAQSCARDRFMPHEYLAECALKSLCPRKEAVERLLRGRGRGG